MLSVAHSAAHSVAHSVTHCVALAARKLAQAEEDLLAAAFENDRQAAESVGAELAELAEETADEVADELADEVGDKSAAESMLEAEEAAYQERCVWLLLVGPVHSVFLSDTLLHVCGVFRSFRFLYSPVSLCLCACVAVLMCLCLCLCVCLRPCLCLCLWVYA